MAARTKPKPRKPRLAKSNGRTMIPSKLDAPEGVGLTVHQALFVQHWFTDANFDQTEAARMSGYEDPAQRGCDMMKHPAVRAAIAAKFDKAAMSVQEALIRETEVARASMEDFMSRGPGGWKVDLNKAKRLGKMHLIKKVRFTRYGIEVELYDGGVSRERILRHHGALHDQTEVNHHHDYKVDMTNIPEDNPEAMVLLAEFSSGRLDYGAFYERFRSLLPPAPASRPEVIDGTDLIREVDPREG